jgi:hypothetical protein
MCGWSLAIFAVLAGSPTSGPDPTALVARLGSSRFSEREEAAHALEELGRDALPPLRAARSARDPEVRARATNLLDRIESALLVQPTQIQLDFQDRPLPEVVRAIGERTGMAPLLDPDDLEKLSGIRVSVRSVDPVPYWAAVDRVCAASGRLRTSLGPASGGGRTTLPNIILFDPGDGARPPAPASDCGPFRARVLSLHYQRDRLLDVAPGVVGDVVSGEQFHAQIQVLAEPRLMIRQGSGNVRISEAIDDLGQSLRLSTPSLAGIPDDGLLEFNEFNAGGAVQTSVALRYPEKPGRVIRRLRGVIPVTVAARKPEPLEVPLVGSSGKTFLGGDVSVAIHELKKLEPNEPATNLQLTVRSRSGAGLSPSAPGRRPRAIRTADFLEQQIEVVDAQGKPFVLFVQEATPEGDSVRINLMLVPTEGATTPTMFRYHGLIRSSAEVEFFFKNVPMP